MVSKNIVSSQKTWDKIAESFDKTRQKPWDETIDFINSLSKDSISADIACGNGRHLIPCANKCKRVIGIDISRKLLEIVSKKIIKQNIENVELLLSNAVNLPLKDNSVDNVIFIAALHNIKGRNNRVRSLSEIKRVLKKDGCAQISVWSRWQDKYRKIFFKKWFTHFNNEEFGDIDVYWRQNGFDIPRFYHLYSKREFLNDIKKANLDLIEVKDVKKASNKYPDNYFARVK